MVLMLRLSQEMCDTRRFYTNGKDLTVEVTEVTYDRSANSLMTLWVKKGLMPRFIDRALCVQVYYDDGEGGCLDMFNPQRKRGRCEIEFSWMLEATPENERRLLEEIERRYNEGE